MLKEHKSVYVDFICFFIFLYLKVQFSTTFLNSLFDFVSDVYQAPVVSVSANQTSHT